MTPLIDIFVIAFLATVAALALYRAVTPPTDGSAELGSGENQALANAYYAVFWSPGHAANLGPVSLHACSLAEIPVPGVSAKRDSTEVELLVKYIEPRSGLLLWAVLSSDLIGICPDERAPHRNALHSCVYAVDIALLRSTPPSCRAFVEHVEPHEGKTRVSDLYAALAAQWDVRDAYVCFHGAASLLLWPEHRGTSRCFRICPRSSRFTKYPEFASPTRHPSPQSSQNPAHNRFDVH
jgi:hypothetical protein